MWYWKPCTFSLIVSDLPSSAYLKAIGHNTAQTVLRKEAKKIKGGWSFQSEVSKVKLRDTSTTGVDAEIKDHYSCLRML